MQIWTWFIKDFENEKAGITEAIQKGEYVRKLMNPKSDKDISYHDALTLSPSLICQEGLEEAIEYCEFDSVAKKANRRRFQSHWIDRGKRLHRQRRHSSFNRPHSRHNQKEKRPFARILSKIAMIMATCPMTAYGLS